MNEKIYRKGNNICIEREGAKLWFNIETLNNLISFHEKELKSFSEAKRHLANQSSGREKLNNIWTDAEETRR